jgi:hypothetical protein
MTRLVLPLALGVGLFSCAPVAAQVPLDEPSPEVHVVALDAPRASDGALVVITHHNRLTFGTLGESILTFDTPRGPVVLRLEVTTNSACRPDCPDMLEVWEAPAGLVAVPAAITTPERGVGQILLIEWSGM